jgi:hypothetical protein
MVGPIFGFFFFFLPACRPASGYINGVWTGKTGGRWFREHAGFPYHFVISFTNPAILFLFARSLEVKLICWIIFNLLGILQLRYTIGMTGLSSLKKACNSLCTSSESTASGERIINILVHL